VFFRWAPAIIALTLAAILVGVGLLYYKFVYKPKKQKPTLSRQITVVSPGKKSNNSIIIHTRNVRNVRYIKTYKLTDLWANKLTDRQDCPNGNTPVRKTHRKIISEAKHNFMICLFLPFQMWKAVTLCLMCPISTCPDVASRLRT